MAQNYYEFVIRGDDETLIAYLDGFFHGRGIRDGYYFSKRHPVRLSFLRELVKYHGEVIHMICESKHRAVIQSAVRQANRQYDFEIKSTCKILKGSFEFEFDTANRGVAGTIKRALGRHPAGVRLVNYRPEEIVDPKAKGPEGYAPVHAYEFKGRGVVEGNIAGVLRVHEKLSAIEFIDCEEIEIHR